ncbi:MAG: hypothetical protein ACLFTR_00040 [Candidatus Woesearchaeota archaeon]
MLSTDGSFSCSLRQVIDSAKDWTRQLYKEKILFDYIFSRYVVKSILESKCFSGDRLLSLMGRLDHGVGLEKDYGLYTRAIEKIQDYPMIEIIDSSIPEYKPSEHRGFPERYDALLLMDNQLAQHANQDNLGEVLKSSYDLLIPGGIVIIEVFNYNKVLKEEFYDFSKLPLMMKEERYYMSRHMKIFDEDILKYLVDIYDKAGHHVKSFTELHFILTKKRLENWLVSHGFHIEAYFGDQEMHDFEVERSPKLIVVASKL